MSRYIDADAIKDKAVAKMVDFHVDWLDCFWDCPNDYEHWIAKQTEREGE